MTEPKYKETFDILENLVKLSNNDPDLVELLARWSHWVERFGVYHHLRSNKRYVGFFTWEHDQKLIYQEEKFTKALLALQELYNNTEKQFDHKDEIEKTVRLLADTELTKLEIRQSRKLLKIQGLARGVRKENIDALRTARSKLIDDVQKNKYSASLKDDEELKKTFELLNRHETKWRFGKLIEKTGHIATAAKATKLGSFLFYVVNEIIPTVFEAIAKPFIPLGQGIATLIGTIPIVGNVVAAIPILFNALKTWYQNKSKTKKAINTIAAILAVSGIIIGAVVLGLGIFTAGAIITAALAMVGFIATEVIPLVRSMQKLANINKEIATSGERITFLEKNILSALTEADKDILLKCIEDAWLANEFNIKSSDNAAALTNAKDLIINGTDVDSLRSNALIKQILASSRLEDFLLDKYQQRVNDLTVYRDELKEIVRDKSATMINCSFTVAGAILLAIPTPPTMIIGAILIIGSTVVGFGIKYKWGEKIAGLFNRIFGRTKVEESVELTEHNSDYKLKKVFGVTNTETVRVEEILTAHVQQPKPGVKQEPAELNPDKTEDDSEKEGLKKTHH